MRHRVWIGLAEVVPEEGNTQLGEGIVGAYVNVLAWADRVEVFRSLASDMLARCGFRMLSIEGSEPLYKPENPEIAALAETLGPTNLVGFDTFHSFPPDA